MGRKKVVTTEEHDDEAEILLPPGAENDEEAKAENDIIEELKTLGGDDGVRWTVHKLAGKPGEASGWCADYSTPELSLQGIRESYGGGKYRIRGTTLSGGRFVATRTVHIMELPKPLNGAPVVNPAMPDIPAMIAALKPGDNGMAAMMPLLLKMIEASSAQMTAVMQAIAGRKDDGPKLTEILALINATKPEKEESAVKTLLEGIKLGQSFAGGGSETGWLDIAGKGLDALKPMIAAQAANLPAPAPAIPGPAPAALPAPNPRPAPEPAQPAPGADPMLQQLQWLRLQLNTLVHQAAKNAAGKGGDPELYADIVLDNLPPFITPEQLYERLAAPDAVAQMAQVDPRVNQYPGWFAAFRQAVLDTFSEDTEGELTEDDNREPGEGDHA